MLVISSSDVNCVATEAKLRFSVRGFGYAPFLWREIGDVKIENIEDFIIYIEDENGDLVAVPWTSEGNK